MPRLSATCPGWLIFTCALPRARLLRVSWRHVAAPLPATVPLDQLHWKLNAGAGARPRVAIGHYVLLWADMAEGRATVRDR